MGPAVEVFFAMSPSQLKIDFTDVRSIVLYAHSPMEVVQ